VFIAITIIGVFIMSETEEYLRGTVRDNMNNAVNQGTLLTSLKNYEDLSLYREEIQDIVEAWGSTLKEEIFVVDPNFNIIAASNYHSGTSALGLLDEGLILKGLSGEKGESETALNTSGGTIPVMNMVFPVDEDKVLGVVFLRADLSSIDDAIENSQEIFLKAMAIALLVTVILGFLISRSITEPINHVTEKAQRMAQGDFSQEVSVKSQDEIGQLAQMFNLLRLELNKTLSQINSEKNKLETVLRHMADGLIAVDLEGRIIHANQAAMDLLKTTPEQVTNTDYDSLIDGVFYGDMTLANLREKATPGPQTESFETGGFIYTIRYDKFRDELDREAGLILIIQDITQRHKLENMQMDFVANVSHELKTPLTTIKSYTETMLDSCPEDPEISKNFLQIIDSEADRMARLVRDLLQLSRLEYKQEEMNKQDINLRELLESAVIKVWFQAQSKQQQVNRLYKESIVAPIFADKDQIEQVLLNVLSNAIKYTEPGGRIDIDLRMEGEQVLTRVKDNGVGIPEEDVSRVFERFFRVDKARSRAMGGTGLGLAISKQIVENHGGKILLDSKEGKGTAVTLQFPLAAHRGKRDID
jgi:two-component system sensor histidine kinase VicK